MKVLVIGSGGREHAIAWKIAQSPHVEKVYVAPGNGGTETEDKCRNVNLSGHEELAAFAQTKQIDLTVIGPETPLAEGIVDRFRMEGLAVVGPDKRASRLEASKTFSKSFMKKYGVRAAKSADFSQFESAILYAEQHFKTTDSPLVIKADGLAAGKGVVVAEDLAHAQDCLASFMKNVALGDAGRTVVLEDFLEGKEVSVLAAVSVRRGKGVIKPFVPARDHKRRFEHGQGPNTGGMGAVAPVPDFSEKAQEDFRVSILEPSLRGMEEEELDYRGFIFFGLMVKNDVCSLLEYNVRLGDPETQAVLVLMEADFAGLCLSILDGSLASFPLDWKAGAVCAPVAVAKDYPGQYRKGDLITLDNGKLAALGAKVFAAGAASSDGGLCTTGGRVLTVSCYGKDADEAWEKAYAGINAIHFEGMSYRKDIGREE